MGDRLLVAGSGGGRPPLHSASDGSGLAQTGGIGAGHPLVLASLGCGCEALARRSVPIATAIGDRRTQSFDTSQAHRSSVVLASRRKDGSCSVASQKYGVGVLARLSGKNRIGKMQGLNTG